MKKLILCILLFLSFTGVSFASFQPIRSTFYLENKETHEIKIFQTISYTTKKTWEIAFNDFIGNTKIGDTSLFKNWSIIQLCPDENTCYNEGTIQTSLFSVSVKHDDAKAVKNLYENHNFKTITYIDFSFLENFHIFYTTIFWSSFLMYLFFLPLNLFFFYGFGYGIYLLFFKKTHFKPLIIIYFGAFVSYTIYYISLFYFGYALLNFSTAWFGFMLFFWISGFFKLILLFLSRDLMREHKKNEKFKSNFSWYILYFYLVMLCLWLFYLLIGDIFNF